MIYMKLKRIQFWTKKYYQTLIHFFSNYTEHSDYTEQSDYTAVRLSKRWATELSDHQTVGLELSNYNRTVVISLHTHCIPPKTILGTVIKIFSNFCNFKNQPKCSQYASCSYLQSIKTVSRVKFKILRI